MRPLPEQAEAEKNVHLQALPHTLREKVSLTPSVTVMRTLALQARRPPVLVRADSARARPSEGAQ
eukprot:6213082-Pleurochrysis_carterae.AAC.3